jgi:hypothetical protein
MFRRLLNIHRVASASLAFVTTELQAKLAAPTLDGGGELFQSAAEVGNLGIGGTLGVIVPLCAVLGLFLSASGFVVSGGEGKAFSAGLKIVGGILIFIAGGLFILRKANVI